MSERDLKPLDGIFAKLQPTGVEERVRWLFGPGAAALRPNVDWKTQQDELEKLQTSAAKDLLAELGPDQLFAFSSTITRHDELGNAIARAPVLSSVKHDLMKRGLLADTRGEVNTGIGILSGLKFQAGENGDNWVQALWQEAIAENWGERAELNIVHYLSPIESMWSEIEKRSPSLSKSYWKTLSIYRISESSDADYVVDHLLAVERSQAALNWLGNNIKIKKPDGALIVRVMKAAAKSDEVAEGNEASMLSYWVGILLDYLETDSEVAEQEVVGLEWMYFQVLRYSQRPPRTLHRALAHDPEFFANLLKLIFLPAEDSGVVEPATLDIEASRKLAGQAYDVLHDWSHVPGADELGVIDPIALEHWVKRARKLLADAGRGEVGDSKIGEILSAAKRVPDQPWPPEPVREVLEVARSRALEQGFEIGLYNRRGVTVRMPHDGGGQERALAASYRRDAVELRFDWPRTAACLERIATSYEADANREDLGVEQRDWL